MANCLTKASAIDGSSSLFPAASSSSSATVRNTAIGSLLPDSISSVAATRLFSAAPCVRRRANTAAASVEPTMAPSSMPSSQDSRSTQAASRPSSAAVTSTPTVARLTEGQRATRNVSRLVRSPPSKMMTARASVPIT
jgi:hypothetical protein